MNDCSTIGDDTHRSFSLVFTSIFGALLRMTTKLKYLMTAYYTPNHGFTANEALFYKSKVG